MANTFSSGKHAIAECDRCGFRYKLKQLKELVVKTKRVNIMVCPSCWEKDHPQLLLGMYPVYDPQGVRNPRAAKGAVVSGVLSNGHLGGGSRIFAWGWNPVGGGSALTNTPNPLAIRIEVGTMSVVTT